MSDLKSKEFKTSIDYTHHDSTTRKECTLVLFDDDGNVIPNNITESPNDVIDSKSDAIESAEPQSDDLIIKGAKGIKDGLYNIKDGKLFQYKAKGGTVRTYKILSAEPSGCESCKWYEPDHLICYPEPSEQVTSKLKNPCDSLLTDDSAECKEQKSKLDLISRADAIEAVQKCIVESELLADWNKAMKSAQDLLSALPSADRPQGEWVIRENGNKECSLCGHERQDGWDYFCGYCGARMRGAE